MAVERFVPWDGLELGVRNAQGTLKVEQTWRWRFTLGRDQGGQSLCEEERGARHGLVSHGYVTSDHGDSRLERHLSARRAALGSWPRSSGLESVSLADALPGCGAGLGLRVPSGPLWWLAGFIPWHLQD